MIRAQQKHFAGSAAPFPNMNLNTALLPLPKRPPLFHPDHLHPRMAGQPPPHSARIIRPGTVSHQGLLGPYPTQQPMVMQRMSGMPAAGRKRFPPPFLPTGARQSLLGPPPFGASLRNPQTGFGPGQQMHPRGHYINNGGFTKTYQRKRDNGSVSAVKTNVQISKPDVKISVVENKPLPSAEENRASGSETEPPVKKQKNPRAGKLHDAVQQNSTSKNSSIEDEKMSVEASDSVEQSRTTEGVGTLLKVTIQHSNESRAFNTGNEETTATVDSNKGKKDNITPGKFSCCICSVTCLDQPDFQTHMISLEHQQKLMEIHHLSNTCLASLIPKMQTIQGRQREDLQRWCPICQCQFSGDLIEHRRTKKHKMAKVSSRPFCTVCKCHFRTPRKFVEHMKSPEHKQRIKELKEVEGPQVMEELSTMDATDCFEGEDEYEEEEDDDEEEEENEEEDILSEQVISDTTKDHGEYDPNTQYGTKFIVPVAGFLCKLCHKFYQYGSRAQENHCKSSMHYKNLQKYEAMTMFSEEDQAKEEDMEEEDEEKLLASSPEDEQNGNESMTEVDKKTQAS